MSPDLSSWNVPRTFRRYFLIPFPRFFFRWVVLIIRNTWFFLSPLWRRLFPNGVSACCTQSPTYYHLTLVSRTSEASRLTEADLFSGVLFRIFHCPGRKLQVTFCATMVLCVVVFLFFNEIRHCLFLRCTWPFLCFSDFSSPDIVHNSAENVLDYATGAHCCPFL